MQKKYEFVAQIRVRFDADLQCDENQKRYRPFDEDDIASLILHAYINAFRNNLIDVDCEVPVNISWVGNLGNTKVSDALPNRHFSTVFPVGSVVSASEMMKSWNMYVRFIHQSLLEDDAYSRYRFLEDRYSSVSKGEEFVAMPRIDDVEVVADIVRDIRDDVSIAVIDDISRRFRMRVLEYLEGQAEDGLINKSDVTTP